MNIEDGKKWVRDGLLHREDGPAIEYYNGARHWYYNGKRHRADGPAIENDCCTSWYVNGIRHREDGPAIVSNVFRAWYKHGKKHRVDGPAIEFSNGDNIWFLNGVQYSEIEHSMVLFFGVDSKC